MTRRSPGSAGAARGQVQRVRKALYYLGRGGQLLGMWLLVVDIFTAGPLGPSPRIFAAGVAVFLVGWGFTKAGRPA